jgi:hypothetical protein
MEQKPAATYPGQLVEDCAAALEIPKQTLPPTLRDQLLKIGSDAVFAAHLEHHFNRVLGGGK